MTTFNRSRKQWERDWSFDQPVLEQGNNARLVQTEPTPGDGSAPWQPGQVVLVHLTDFPEGTALVSDELGNQGLVPLSILNPIGARHVFCDLYLNDRVVLAQAPNSSHSFPGQRVGMTGTVIGYEDHAGTPLVPRTHPGNLRYIDPDTHVFSSRQHDPLPEQMGLVLVHFDDDIHTTRPDYRPYAEGQPSHWLGRGWLVPLTCLNLDLPTPHVVADVTELIDSYNEVFGLDPIEDEMEDEEDEDDDSDNCPHCDRYIQHCRCDNDDEDDEDESSSDGLMADYHDCNRHSGRWVPCTVEPAFGLEMEYQCNNSDTRADLLSDFNDADLIGAHYFHCERDGSLSNSRGFELIAPPFTIDQLNTRTNPWVQVLEIAKGKVYESDAEAGLHVNMDFLRSFGNSEATLALFMWYFNRLPFSAHLARRNNTEYAPLFTSVQMHEIHDMIHGGYKYRAVRRDAGRVEVRAFANTTNMDMLRACVQYVDLLASWAGDNEIDESSPDSGPAFVGRKMFEFFELARKAGPAYAQLVEQITIYHAQAVSLAPLRGVLAHYLHAAGVRTEVVANPYQNTSPYYEVSA